MSNPIPNTKTSPLSWLNSKIFGLQDITAWYVVIPTFNEAENLPLLANELFSQPVPNLHLVIVDDNSPDGTGKVADELKELYPHQMHVIHRQGKLGLGPAYRQGFHYALDQGADYVVQMDADFSHSPSYLTEFLQVAPRYDVIVGSRYISGSQLDPKWSRQRYLLSWWANSLYVRLILGLKVHDATGGFKCWSRQALSTVLQYPVMSNGYIFQVEMAYLTEKLGFSVLEIPIFFEERRSGNSKMSSKVKLEAFWRTWYLRWRYRDIQYLALYPSRDNLVKEFYNRTRDGIRSGDQS